MWFCSWISPRGLTPMGIPNHHISQRSFSFSSHVGLSSHSSHSQSPPRTKAHIEPPSNDTSIPYHCVGATPYMNSGPYHHLKLGTTATFILCLRKLPLSLPRQITCGTCATDSTLSRIYCKLHLESHIL